MKLNEIIELADREQLDEISFKQAVAGGALALGTLMSPSLHHTDQPPVTSSQRAEMNRAVMANTILKKYSVSPKLAHAVASLAQKYEKSSFPKAEDILAIAGIESSFRPHAVSKLKSDPAMGLMQVRPNVWDLDPRRLSKDVEYQIKSGAEVLHKYFKLLGNAEDAVHAYNVGLGNFRKGKHNPGYVQKYKTEKQLYRT